MDLSTQVIPFAKPTSRPDADQGLLDVVDIAMAGVRVREKEVQDALFLVIYQERETGHRHDYANPRKKEQMLEAQATSPQQGKPNHQDHDGGAQVGLQQDPDHHP